MIESISVVGLGKLGSPLWAVLVDALNKKLRKAERVSLGMVPVSDVPMLAKER